MFIVREAPCQHILFGEETQTIGRFQTFEEAEKTLKEHAKSSAFFYPACARIVDTETLQSRYYTWDMGHWDNGNWSDGGILREV